MLYYKFTNLHHFHEAIFQDHYFLKIFYPSIFFLFYLFFLRNFFDYINESVFIIFPKQSTSIYFTFKFALLIFYTLFTFFHIYIANKKWVQF